MRVAELVPGVSYYVNTGAGRTAWDVGILLDVEPWVRAYLDGGYGPVPVADLSASRRPSGRGPRSVPMMMLDPLVQVADGTQVLTEFGFWLNVGSDDRRGGWSLAERRRVRPDQLDVVADAQLVPLPRIKGVCTP